MRNPSERIGKYKSMIVTVLALVVIAAYLMPLEKISALTLPSFIANNPIFANFFHTPIRVGTSTVPNPTTDPNGFRYGFVTGHDRACDNSGAAAHNPHCNSDRLGPSIPASIVQRIHVQFHINLGLPL